ncbi:MAG: hypothetical protein ACI8PZ_005178 [Myxococcota bacterium]|jgi:hypothetical protein
MHLIALVAMILPTTAFAGGPILSISGACPGPMAVSASGLTPGGMAAVLRGSGPGSDVMPAGPCRGGASGLSGLAYVTTVPVDGRGNVSAMPTISGPLCGQYVQFVDATACTLTNLAELGGGAPVDCDPATEVEADGRCYYLDGSGGACDPGYELAPQSVLASIAPEFTGKDYKNAVSDNCCIWHADQDVELQDWGLGSNCNSPGPFSDGPTLGGAGCMDALNLNPAQLTLCQSSGDGDGFMHDNGLGIIWYNDVPTDTINEDQARLSCEQSYGVCYLSEGDCAGLGYCQDPSSGQCWGWEDGCSGDAGRVWQYGSSYTTYGYWN